LGQQSEVSLQASAKNSKRLGTRTRFSLSSSVTFCLSRLKMSLIPDELMLNSDGLEFETLYYW